MKPDGTQCYVYVVSVSVCRYIPGPVAHNQTSFREKLFNRLAPATCLRFVPQRRPSVHVRTDQVPPTRVRTNLLREVSQERINRHAVLTVQRDRYKLHGPQPQTHDNHMAVGADSYNLHARIHDQYRRPHLPRLCPCVHESSPQREPENKTANRVWLLQ